MTDLKRERALIDELYAGDKGLFYWNEEDTRRIADALAAARREGAEEMRERAAQRAENLWFDARDTEWDEGVNCAKRRVAHAIRALSLTPEERV